MTDPAAFIAARLDEDEAIARRAGQSTPRRTGNSMHWSVQTADEPSEEGAFETGIWVIDEREIGAAVVNGQPKAEHLVRHDPARVLRETAAKRAILADYQIVMANNAIENAAHGDQHDEVKAAARDLIAKVLRMVLHRLAAPYADHPDYQQEWVP